jgi:hypothetical protein
MGDDAPSVGIQDAFVNRRQAPPLHRHEVFNHLFDGRSRAGIYSCSVVREAETVYFGTRRLRNGQRLREAQTMHKVEIPSWAIERAMAPAAVTIAALGRRGKTDSVENAAAERERHGEANDHRVPPMRHQYHCIASRIVLGDWSPGAR